MKRRILLPLLAFALTMTTAANAQSVKKSTKAKTAKQQTPDKPGEARTVYTPGRGIDSVRVTRTKDSTSTMVGSAGIKEPAPANKGAKLVDLGLSVKWADRNIAANAPEDCGGHYGWGDATGKNTSDDFNEYPNANPPAEISNSAFDIAHVNWGGGWRLPTLAEVKELTANCTYEWTEVNGVKGGKFTSKKNGASIFLPATGYRGSDEVYEKGEAGYYWSGTGSVKYPGRSSALSINAQTAEDIIMNRSGGFNIRPVAE